MQGLYCVSGLPCICCLNSLHRYHIAPPRAYADSASHFPNAFLLNHSMEQHLLNWLSVYVNTHVGAVKSLWSIVTMVKLCTLCNPLSVTEPVSLSNADSAYLHWLHPLSHPACFCIAQGIWFFKCGALAPLRQQHADFFTPRTYTMHLVFAQHHLGVLNYIIDCLNFVDIWHCCYDWHKWSVLLAGQSL